MLLLALHHPLIYPESHAPAESAPWPLLQCAERALALCQGTLAVCQGTLATLSRAPASRSAASALAAAPPSSYTSPLRPSRCALCSGQVDPGARPACGPSDHFFSESNGPYLAPVKFLRLYLNFFACSFPDDSLRCLLLMMRADYDFPHGFWGAASSLPWRVSLKLLSRLKGMSDGVSEATVMSYSAARWLRTTSSSSAGVIM
mmetsp:Transcript_20502/g.44837  ORF Transcript_20502/g.44837 Transcript_20502/m.44837 type:complete len:203 (-) Transcript_20502:603-1211(-)